jgi:hypothetical protein
VPHEHRGAKPAHWQAKVVGADLLKVERTVAEEVVTEDKEQAELIPSEPAYLFDDIVDFEFLPHAHGAQRVSCEMGRSQTVDVIHHRCRPSPVVSKTKCHPQKSL